MKIIPSTTQKTVAITLLKDKITSILSGAAWFFSIHLFRLFFALQCIMMDSRLICSYESMQKFHWIAIKRSQIVLRWTFIIVFACVWADVAPLLLTASSYPNVHVKYCVNVQMIRLRHQLSPSLCFGDVPVHFMEFFDHFWLSHFCWASTTWFISDAYMIHF